MKKMARIPLIEMADSEDCREAYLDGKQRSRDATPPTRTAPLPKAIAPVHGGCWCGRPSDHDWPNRAEGAPHPKENPL